MYKAIGHCRVSKGDTDEIKNSLNSQQSQIENFAIKELGLKSEEIKWYREEEARSAYSERADWTLFEEAINEACKNPDIEYFIDFSQERFCRNRRRSQSYKDKLRRNNIKLRFASGDVEDPDSDSGFWQDGIQEMVAEAYSRKTSNDTLRGCLENAITRDPETQYTYKNGGAPPFWLKAKKVIINENKYGDKIKKTIWVENDTLVTATLEGKLVTKTVWDWARYSFIELRINQQLSLDKVRDFLNEIGLPAPRAKFWSGNSLYYCEKNHALYGLGVYNKRQFSRNANGRLKDEEKWVQIPNAHPSLLTKEEFGVLQSVSALKCRKSGKRSANSTNIHLLTGQPDKFTCKSCGGNIITSGDYYVCSEYNSHGKKGCGAPVFNVSCDWLDTKIIQGIRRKISPELVDKLYQDITESFASADDTAKNIKLMEKVLFEKEKSVENLLNHITFLDASANTLVIKTIAEKLNILTEEKEKIQKELKELKQLTNKPLPTKEEVKNYLRTFEAFLARSNPAIRRDIIWSCVKSIIIDPTERSVDAEFYFNPISIFLEDTTDKQALGHIRKKTQIGSSSEMVAGAGFEPTTFGL